MEPDKVKRFKIGVAMNEIVKFFSEVRVELSKVLWPSWDEWTGSTIIVLVVIAFFSIYLGVLDLGLGKLAKFVFGQFGI